MAMMLPEARPSAVAQTGRHAFRSFLTSCKNVVRAMATPVALLAATAGALEAQETRIVEKDGVKYQETRQVVRHVIPETRLEQREYTVYREQYSTEVRESQHPVSVPVTEYHWVPYYERSWNPFNPPYLTYRLVPTTRWETKVATLQTPVTQRQLIPEKRTQQVAVTTQRIAEGEIVSRVPLASNAATAVAGTGATSGATVGGISRHETAPLQQATPAWRASSDSSIRR